MKSCSLVICTGWTILTAGMLAVGAGWGAPAGGKGALATLFFAGTWAAGVAIILFGCKRLLRVEQEKRAAEQALSSSLVELEQKVRMRTRELEEANIRLKCEVEERMRAEKALRESEMKYRIVADNTYGWEFWTDMDGRFIYSSPACRTITGYGADEFVADPGLFLRIVHPDDVPGYLEHRAMVEQQLKSDSAAFRILRADGSWRWIGHICQPAFDDDGNCIGTRGSNRDISDRKKSEEEIQRLNAELELRVQKRTAQLEASNKELEGFCHAISHDLRAPLTRIEGYSRAILEDFAESLGSEGQSFAERIMQGSLQLKSVIDVLLELSRLTRSELTLQEVDLSHIAESIVNELRETEPDRRVDARVAPGVMVKGDASMLMLALKNLLHNAWKHTANHAAARIEFGVLEQKRRKVYFVRDDGAGFDMKFAKKLFKPFERIHRPHEFPGAGIGLATVQRIIQRHGGKIWAEGEVEKGATFYFSL